MARPRRIELSGGLYHVTSRGDGREDIYLSDAGLEVWLDLFGRVCERFNWRFPAYCQMTNHYHVVVETPEGNLSQGMRQLNGVYTQYVNRAHKRVRHVFQGRYKVILVEKDSHLLELARYVSLNPVRAGMVKEIGDWPWSSYSATIGTVAAPAWLQVDWLVGHSIRKGVERRNSIWILSVQEFGCRACGAACAAKFSSAASVCRAYADRDFPWTVAGWNSACTMPFASQAIGQLSGGT